jgi:hypothetical protein
MNDRTRGLLRDGGLALLALAGLRCHLNRTGQTRALRSPVAALVGTGGAVLIEATMLRYPEATRAGWERPETRAGSLVGLWLVGRTLAEQNGALAVAACCWGLVAYLGLLACVLVGRANPVSRLVGE